MKMVGALAMGAGCLIGLVDAVTQLFQPGRAAADFNYLNALSLSFQIDTLSAFFLVIINYESQENRKASYLYFVFSQVGAMFILAAFGVMYAHSEHLAALSWSPA
jgi:formate hydrogenlyase subunit 3/multisubunit Na+/H+ antiporter MnhD subunit